MKRFILAIAILLFLGSDYAFAYQTCGNNVSVPCSYNGSDYNARRHDSWGIDYFLNENYCYLLRNDIHYWENNIIYDVPYSIVCEGGFYGVYFYQNNPTFFVGGGTGTLIQNPPSEFIEWAEFAPPETSLIFPLNKECSGILCTPYTAEISSVMDHSMTTPYSYDGIILGFNGEGGDVDQGCWCYTTNLACNSNNYTSCAVAGFKNLNGTNFFPNSEINYIDVYLYYDGHPGYDYPASPSTDTIVSPAAGTLCVATTYTAIRNPLDVWRDTEHCPYSTIGSSTTWSNYHTFYIIHEGLHINGATNDYITVFLHSDDLENSVMSNIEQSGYATVTRNQHIAEVGGYGPNGPTAFANHVHLEVYKRNGENWERVDPYGDGTNNILWE